MVTVIAEAGVNHNGDINLATQLIDAAADAGADIVKFQSFRADALVTPSARKADYQMDRTGGGQSQYEMLKELELSPSDHERLIIHCKTRNIEFLSTPFDFKSLRLLQELNVPSLKIGSGDMSNAPLVHACAQTGKNLILSTGMASLEEVEEILGVAAHGYIGSEPPSTTAFTTAYTSEEGQAILREKVIVMHCTTAYPTPLADINLAAMDTMRDRLPTPIGFSDHSDGIHVSIAAAARGAMMIEKHLTLDRSMPGPDHQASLEPAEFGEMTRGIRAVCAAIGSGNKAATKSEQANISVVRKSLVAACPIATGETFTVVNITLKRPGDGVEPMRYWDFLGQKADRDYQPNDIIQEPKS